MWILLVSLRICGGNSFAIEWIVIIVSLLTGVTLFGLYKSDKREIDTILDKVIDSSCEINLREYQRLLGD